jgi:PRTRC genetic system protein C
MHTTALIREFRYNAVRLADPLPTMTLLQVRDFYSNVYPELTSADIEGPEQAGNKQIFTFRRAVGTKG